MTKQVMNLGKLERELEEDEGFRASAYQDHLGFWTIGIGTLIDARKGAGITREEAYLLLRNRLGSKFQEMDKRMSWWRDQPDPVQRALANMAYQMGVEGLLGFRNTLALIQQGKYSEAADNAMKSLWAKQTPNRAKKVTDLIRSAGGSNVG